MTDKSILKKLHAVAAQLGKASKWAGSSMGVDASKDDYVFELLCFFDIAMSKGAMQATVVARSDPSNPAVSIARWPKKPAEMRNFSYLKLADQTTGQLLFRLCPGVNVEDRFGKKRAPDVNLLKAGSSEEPKCTDLIACWDAKFLAVSTKRLSDVAVSDFIYTFNCLGQPAPSSRWQSEVTAGRYQSSGLVTNGMRSTEPDAALTDAGVLETEQFPAAPQTRP